MYTLPHKSYEIQRQEGILFTQVMHGVPLRDVWHFSGTASPGLYGYMYPLTKDINLNDNLQDGYGSFQYGGVSLHEILHQFNHQSDEYDTRRWTEAKIEALDTDKKAYFLLPTPRSDLEQTTSRITNCH